MRGPTPRRLLDFVTRRLRLQRYLRDSGDGRPQPQIPAKALLWSLLIGQVLSACSFLAVERLVRSAARRALAVSRSFSDDALDYFTERLDPTFTRAALARVLHQAKRNKAFETSGGIGLAVDGSTVGWRASSGCSLCRPYRKDQEIAGYRHHVVLATVVGTGLSLPFDVEPYGRAIANTPPDNVCCVGPSNCSASVSRPTWSWMENSPPLLFSMLLASWACQWWRA